MSRELLQRALMGDYPQLIAAVRQYLAQPAPAPVALTDGDLLRIATTLGLPFGMLNHDYCKSMEIEPGTRSHGEVTCDGMVRFARAAIAASAPQAQPTPAVPTGSWEHLKVLMQHSAWEDTLQLCDALANIDDFSKEFAAPAVPAVDCRTCKWFHQPGDSPIAGCISHGRCVGSDLYQALPPVKLWRTAP